MTERQRLLEALPPATDYLTYLVIIEYNLTEESLPTLHEILQDAKLTTNIGWDLVHLLLPLLPASQQCLQDIARLGNPREVILKVTECLRVIDFELGNSSDDDDDEDEDENGQLPAQDPSSHNHPHITEPAASGIAAGTTTQAQEVIPTPLPIDQFACLLSMLSILHPRIKTQYPSRFLSTSLQAVLYAFSQASTNREELLSAIVRFVKDIAGPKRPHLPPRQSSSSILASKYTERAPDPESDASPDGPPLSEADMQIRLLQSVITFVLEEYMLALNSAEDVPGLAWSSRLAEKLHPERNVPGRPTFADKFEKNTSLRSRLTAVGDIIALSQDLDISSADLLAAAQAPETPYIRTSDAEADPPKSAADVPFSKLGSLFLYTAKVVRKALYASKAIETPITIFPVHHGLLKDFIDSTANGSAVGSEPEALLDTLLVLALQAVESGDIGQPQDTETFNQYLQTLSLISSNCPSPSLRYAAYFLTTTILRSNPSDIERLAFIKDTLEHCPFDNLKVAAISWIKGETIEANIPDRHAGATSSNDEPGSAGATDERSIFGTPVALDNVAPFIFPDIGQDFATPTVTDAWTLLDQQLNFYLASLNFYFLLLSAEHLRAALNITRLHINHDIGKAFLGPLRAAATRFKEESGSDGELGKSWNKDGNANAELARLKLLESTLEKVEALVATLDERK